MTEQVAALRAELSESIDRNLELTLRIEELTAQKRNARRELRRLNKAVVFWKTAAERWLAERIMWANAKK